MKQNSGLKLGALQLRPVEPAQLAQFCRSMQSVMLPKVRDDEKRRRRNVAAARGRVAY